MCLCVGAFVCVCLSYVRLHVCVCMHVCIYVCECLCLLCVVHVCVLLAGNQYTHTYIIASLGGSLINAENLKS